MRGFFGVGAYLDATRGGGYTEKRRGLATEGELARFAGEAARWLDAGDGSVPTGAALETAFTALKAPFTAEEPIALRRL
jgi:hypothetical protein